MPVLHLDDVKPIDVTPQERIWPWYTSPDTNVGFATAAIHESGLHYHRKTLEIYRVVSGDGFAYLNDEQRKLTPGSIVIIEPGTRHMVKKIGVQPVVLDVTTMPSWRPEDHHLV